MVKELMKKQKQNVQSTIKNQQEQMCKWLANQDESLDTEPASPALGTRHQDVFCQIHAMMYTDQTGSNRGNQQIIVMYELDSNFIDA